VEPWIGDLEGEVHPPRLAVLGLNPGRFHPELQSRTGLFADEIRQAGAYSSWARSAPYLRDPWVQLHGANRYFEDRLRFTGRWLGLPDPEPNDMLVVELFPWHSTGVTGPMRPPPAVIQEFVWNPLAELDLPVIFAFGSEWARLAQRLTLPLKHALGRGGAGYGSSVPSAVETERLRAALA